MKSSLTKYTNKRSHLDYAAVHQDKDSYTTAVKIHHISSVVRLAIFGGIIYFSKSDFIPLISDLIKVFL